MFGEMTNRVEFAYQSLDEAFPACDPLVIPCGSRILVQMRTPKNKTKGGIIIPDDVRETEYWVTQVAKVIAMGPLCYRDVRTLETWPEGEWCSVGDFVRVPQHGGDRWTVTTETGEEAMIVMHEARHILGRVPEPTKIKAFI